MRRWSSRTSMAARWPESPVGRRAPRRRRSRGRRCPPAAASRVGFDQELAHRARCRLAPSDVRIAKLSRCDGASDQHQIRDVRARDQDDEDGDRGEGQPRWIGDPAEEAIVDRDDARPDSSARLRMLAPDSVDDRFDLHSGVSEEGAGSPASDRRRAAPASRDWQLRHLAAADGGGQTSAVVGRPGCSARMPTILGRHTVDEDRTISTWGSESYACATGCS